MIDSCRYGQAISVLSNLLKALQTRQDCSEVSDISGLDQFMDYSDDQKPSDGKDLIDVMNENPQFIYRRGIRIPHSFASSKDCNSATTASITVFNLALAHHLAGIETKDEVTSSILLQKALKLYAAALRFLGGQVSESNILFSLAIWNNSGVIFDSMQKRANSAQCFGQLLLLLTFFNDTHRDHKGPPEQFVIRGFYHNVDNHFFPNKQVVAPAA
eukprot:scaffold1311_cov99-Cylindrotheca_fusiformis.AAC.3